MVIMYCTLPDCVYIASLLCDQLKRVPSRAKIRRNSLEELIRRTLEQADGLIEGIPLCVCGHVPEDAGAVRIHETAIQSAVASIVLSADWETKLCMLSEMDLFLIDSTELYMYAKALTVKIFYFLLT